MEFNYNESKKRIIDILSSKTKIKNVNSIPKNKNEFTYDNGIKSWVGALFIDIRNSTDYFKNNKEEIVARIMRAFCSELIMILRQNDNYRQIGIRGDCIYAIYSAPKQDHLKEILSDSIFINTFQKMFQNILNQNNLPGFEIGVGLGASKDLVVKTGNKNTSINDYIWIGNAVIDASKLSGQGNKNDFAPIVMDSCFYTNIKDKKANDSYTYDHYISQKYSSLIGENVYHCDMITTNFDKWIKKEFKNGK